MKVLLTGAIVTLSLVGFSARAEDAACVSIDADLDRLACYDKESGRTPKSETIATSSKWSVSSDKSEFKDTTDVYLSLESNDPVTCNQFGRQEAATLLVRCMESKTSIYISTNCHLTSGFGGYGNVDVRIDDGKSFVSSMDDSTDNKALGLWSGGEAIPLIKKMIGKDRMIVRFTPFNQSKVTAAFDIKGLDEAIKPLREACKW